MHALDRYADLLVRGIVPEDLKRSGLWVDATSDGDFFSLDWFEKCSQVSEVHLMRAHYRLQIFSALAFLAALVVAPSATCQTRDRDRLDDRVTRIEPGTTIRVRTNDAIDAERFDNRVYYGVVDQGVRGDNGRLAIPRGSRVELIVRVMRDNDLVLDLESVNVNGQRYAIQTEKNHVEAQRDNSLVGSILGAITGGQAQGQAVHIPRDAVLNFRIQTPLTMGVAERGVDRDGNHYHDYYRPNDYYTPNDPSQRNR